MKILRTLSIILVGLVFIFSGTVKAIDPLGSAYKFHDYFQAFGLGSLQFFSLPLAIILCLAEFLTGFTILTGVRRLEGVWGALILMLIFTPLTFILALTNPVSDCGCFGDAIHLSNWHTFEKNIVLLFLVVIIFRKRKITTGNHTPSSEWLITSAAAILFTGFAIYNLIFLPLVDFLPYSTGTYIPEKMIIPEGAQVARYETSFIYEKKGIKKEFTLRDYPANDTSWKFIEQKSRVINKGYAPPIHDFSITTTDNRNITDSILMSPRPILLMISKKLELADSKRLEKGFKTGNKCLSNDIGFYILTSSGSEVTGLYNNGLKICLTDETTLKTMVRSNPGYILVCKGIIKGKWSWANLPADISSLKKLSIK